MKIRTDCRCGSKRGVHRLLIGILLGAIMVSSGGCFTPRVIHIKDPDIATPAVAKRDLGINYLSSLRTGMAIRELRASMRLDPNDPQTHLWLAEAYRRKGKTEQAEVLLLDALRLSGDEEHSMVMQATLLTLSALLSQMGRYAESLEHCEALVADPTFSAPWRPLTNCGWALFKLGRLDEARTHFDDALDFHPRFGPALLNLGIVQAKQGHTLAAITALERALASRRLGAMALGEVHYRLGEIYVGLRRQDDAVEHFREATVKAPYANWGTQSQAYLDLLN